MATKPVTMKQALRILTGTAHSSTVDTFIQYVNSRFSSAPTMMVHRCSPSLGHFYQISMDLVATPEDCFEIEEAFRSSWGGVQVTYWKGRLAISLDCGKGRDWNSHYNGVLLSESLSFPPAPLLQAA